MIILLTTTISWYFLKQAKNPSPNCSTCYTAKPLANFSGNNPKQEYISDLTLCTDKIYSSITCTFVKNDEKMAIYTDFFEAHNL